MAKLVPRLTAFKLKDLRMDNSIDPNREQFDQFKRLPRNKPIMMLNLIRLRAHAAYDDGSVCSGAQAYRHYNEKSRAIFSRQGGKIIWRGKPQVVLIGPPDECWDIAFIARYPTADAFLGMITDPQYQSVVYHRQAAVDDSRLIRLEDMPSGNIC